MFNSQTIIFTWLDDFASKQKSLFSAMNYSFESIFSNLNCTNAYETGKWPELSGFIPISNGKCIYFPFFAFMLWNESTLLRENRIQSVDTVQKWLFLHGSKMTKHFQTQTRKLIEVVWIHLNISPPLAMSATIITK